MSTSRLNKPNMLSINTLETKFETSLFTKHFSKILK